MDGIVCSGGGNNCDCARSIAVSFCKKMACLDAILFRKRSRERGRERAAVPVIVSLLEVESHSLADGRVELQHIEFQFA